MDHEQDAKVYIIYLSTILHVLFELVEKNESPNYSDPGKIIYDVLDFINLECYPETLLEDTIIPVQKLKPKLHIKMPTQQQRHKEYQHTENDVKYDNTLIRGETYQERYDRIADELRSEIFKEYEWDKINIQQKGIICSIINTIKTNLFEKIVMKPKNRQQWICLYLNPLAHAWIAGGLMQPKVEGFCFSTEDSMFKIYTLIIIYTYI